MLLDERPSKRLHHLDDLFGCLGTRCINVTNVPADRRTYGEFRRLHEQPRLTSNVVDCFQCELRELNERLDQRILANVSDAGLGEVTHENGRR